MRGTTFPFRLISIYPTGEILSLLIHPPVGYFSIFSYLTAQLLEFTQENVVPSVAKRVIIIVYGY